KQIEAGVRPGTIAIAKARLAQAKAGYEAALQALADAQGLRDEPQELEMQVAISEVRVEAAQYRLEQAAALKDAAEVAKNLAEYTEDQIRNWPYPVPPPKMPQELQLAPYDWWQAWAGVNAASASLEDAKALLAYWRSVLANPIQWEAQVVTAQAAVKEAQAAVELAQAQLDAYEAGATEEQLAAARARVEQAQAALDALLTQRSEIVIRAPSSGVVLSRAVHIGEVVAPGGKILGLADLAQVKLTVYVTENRLGEVALNQKVTVRVDAYPGRTFEGRVVRIADQAQFTPRNVATKEERVNTVYAVEISLPNEEGLLKPGMAADAMFGERGVMSDE
ncbi:MAG: efflux RND transporter periplasmic adaptor subunit, partial [Chloroflexi bacterium]|nr:efflux RND transporter periplasmic adaptor subunit [Chloroflexota bacterium]